MEHCKIKAKRRNSCGFFIHLYTGNLITENLLEHIKTESFLIPMPLITHNSPERFHQEGSRAAGRVKHAWFFLKFPGG